MRTSSAANASPGETLTVLVLSTGYYLFILVKCSMTFQFYDVVDFKHL